VSVETRPTSAVTAREWPELKVRLFIDGQWRDGGAGSLPIEDPGTARATGDVALADDEDLRDAIDAAQRAFHDWSRLPAGARGEVLKRAAQLLRERTDDIALTLSREGGKTTAEARAELGRAYENLLWNGEEAARVEGRVVAGKTATSQRLVVPAPIGVVAAFTAWNFPALLATRKLGAILAAGCTTVLKAAEATPGTVAEVVRTLADAGAPTGVVNLVFGDPAAVSRHLIRTPEVRAVTFTGSTAVGRLIAAQAGENLKRTVLELGGHAPVVVDRDVDIDHVVSTTLPAKVGSAGQSCVAPSRYLVHETRFAEFTDRMVEAMDALVVGAFTEEGVDVGPVINEGRLDALERLTKDAVDRGARLCCGGERLARDGHFFPPTVLADVPADAEIMTEEPFGPICVVNRFSTIDDAIEQANATDYAFAAYVFSDSLATRRRVLAGLRASNIGINQMAPAQADAPLGGMDVSGIGYEGGRDGVAAFQQLRLISETAAG
jgi:succinate-semialdehyde dehydrogenase / glutarate-semialdehyde dehydrogenase